MGCLFLRETTCKLRRRYQFGFQVQHLCQYCDTQIIKKLHLSALLQLFNEILDPLDFSVWSLDQIRILDFLPAHLVEVFRNACQYAQLREKQSLFQVFTLDNQQKLSRLFILNVDVVLIAIVLEHVCLLIDNHMFCLLEADIDNFEMIFLAVFDHDYLIGELGLEQLQFLLVIAVMILVEVVNEVEDGFVAYHFFRQIDLEEQFSLQLNEFCLVQIINDEVVDLFLLLKIEIVATFVDLLKVILDHEVPEAVFEQGEQLERTIRELQCLKMLHHDLVIVFTELSLLLQLLGGVDCEFAEDGVSCMRHDFKELRHDRIKELLEKRLVLVGDRWCYLGVVHHQLALLCTNHFEKVGGDIDRFEDLVSSQSCRAFELWFWLLSVKGVWHL